MSVVTVACKQFEEDVDRLLDEIGRVPMSYHWTEDVEEFVGNKYLDAGIDPIDAWSEIVSVALTNLEAYADKVVEFGFYIESEDDCETGEEIDEVKRAEFAARAVKELQKWGQRP